MTDRNPTDPRSVRVELIWPAERGAKDDSKGGTSIVWSGTGDIQDYPAEKWHLLAPHVDVWRLVDEEAHTVAAVAQQAVAESPQKRVERLNRERDEAHATEPDQAEADRLAALEAKGRGQEEGKDVVTLSRQPLQVDPAAPLDEEQLAGLADEQVRWVAEQRGYKLHARLSPVNLRAKFLEAQSGV